LLIISLKLIIIDEVELALLGLLFY